MRTTPSARVRAAFAVLDAVRDLGLEARIGIESGELVVEDVASTFATGEAVNLAARLQQSGARATITLGPGRAPAHRRARSRWRTSARSRSRPAPSKCGRGAPCASSTRRGSAARAPGSSAASRSSSCSHNSYERTVRDRRATLVTVFGDPGVGKSRLIDGVHRRESSAQQSLTGRALPYGEGVAFWPIASMVKASAGITDHATRPSEAFEKLRVCCESEAVADLLGVALGVLGAAEETITAGTETGLGSASLGGTARPDAAARARLRGRPLGGRRECST